MAQSKSVALSRNAKKINGLDDSRKQIMMKNHLQLTLLSIGFLFSTSTLGFTQAWLPPAHTGALTAVFQRISNTGHRLNDGNADSMFPGKSTDAAIFIAVEYSFTDRLLTEIGIPFVFAKYIGPGETPPPFLSVDSCFCWHSSFQDFNFTVRYNLIGQNGGVFALTPSFSYGTPSHDYVYQGEAVVGRNLNEVTLASDAGLRFDAISPRLTVQGRYSYTFVEHVLDIPNNRSNITIEPEWLLTHNFEVHGLALWQITHGGLRAPEDLIANPQFGPEHDRLLHDNYFRAGGGISFQMSHLNLFASYIAYVNGINTHLGRAITFGSSWPFEL
jgi:hypothetical protein